MSPSMFAARLTIVKNKLNTRRASVAALLLSAVAGFAATHACAQTVATVVPGTLSIGMQVTYPPFEYYENGEPKGFDPELSRDIAKQLGLTAKFIDTPLPELVLGLKASRFDMAMAAMYVTPERASQAWAIPYAQTGSAILMTVASGLKPRTLEELCGVHVGIVQGTAWVAQLHQVSDSYCKSNGKPPVEISEFGSTAYVMQAMLSNNVQGGVQAAPTAKLLAEKSNGRVIVSSPDPINPQTIGIFVRKDNKALHDALVGAFDQVKKSGAYDELLQRYGLRPVPVGAQ